MRVSGRKPRLRIKAVSVTGIRIQPLPEARKPAPPPEPQPREEVTPPPGVASPIPPARQKIRLLMGLGLGVLVLLTVTLVLTRQTDRSPVPLSPPVSPSAPPGSRRPLPAPMLPRMWVLTIGINEYGSPRLNLKFAAHDAEKIAEMLKRQEGKLFHEVRVIKLINEEATREKILDTIVYLSRHCSLEDVVFVFVAGHGIRDPRQDNQYYFLPYRANTENFITHGLRWTEFAGILRILSNTVKRIVLAVDTCHAGATSRANLAKGVDLLSGYVLSASKEDQVSIEDDNFRLPGESRGHGAFTYALLRGLAGEAKSDENGRIKADDLYYFIKELIPVLTNNQQQPDRFVTGSEIIYLAVK